MFSYIDHLECTQCGKTYPHDELSKISPCCNKVLFARYNLAQLKADKTREDWIDRPSNMWRFAELMPVVNPDNILTLGEGGTPLLEANQLGSKLGMSKLLIKEELSVLKSPCQNSTIILNEKTIRYYILARIVWV